MQRIKFYVDTNRANEFTRAVDAVRGLIQNAVDQYNLVSREQIIHLEQLQSFFGPTFEMRIDRQMVENLVYDSFIPADGAKVNGVTLNRAKLREIMELPALDDLFKALEAVRQYSPGIYLKHGVFWSVYSLKDGKVVVNKDAAKQHIDTNYSTYAEDPAEVERLNLVRDVCSALNNLIAKHPDVNTDLIQAPGMILMQDRRFTPAEGFVKYGIIQNPSPIFNLKIQ